MNIRNRLQNSWYCHNYGCIDLKIAQKMTLQTACLMVLKSQFHSNLKIGMKSPFSWLHWSINCYFPLRNFMKFVADLNQIWIVWFLKGSERICNSMKYLLVLKGWNQSAGRLELRKSRISLAHFVLYVICSSVFSMIHQREHFHITFGYCK